MTFFDLGRGRVARFLDQSLLALARDRASIAPDPRTTSVILWSGSCAELDDPPGNLFDAHPRTWAAHGWAALERACAHAAAATTDTILIRPHARHVLSDIPSLKRFAHTIAPDHPGRFELFIDPPSMLDTTHHDRGLAPDTIARILEEAPTLGLPSFLFPLPE